MKGRKKKRCDQFSTSISLYTPVYIEDCLAAPPFPSLKQDAFDKTVHQFNRMQRNQNGAGVPLDVGSDMWYHLFHARGRRILARKNKKGTSPSRSIIAPYMRLPFGVGERIYKPVPHGTYTREVREAKKKKNKGEGGSEIGREQECQPPPKHVANKKRGEA